jgi:hypothetical protein
MAYNPYCYAPQWYPAHVHYYSRGDSDNDCDDRNRGESGGASYHKPMAAGGCFRAVVVAAPLDAPGLHPP